MSDKRTETSDRRNDDRRSSERRLKAMDVAEDRRNDDRRHNERRSTEDRRS